MGKKASGQLHRKCYLWQYEKEKEMLCVVPFFPMTNDTFHFSFYFTAFSHASAISEQPAIDGCTPSPVQYLAGA